MVLNKEIERAINAYSSTYPKLDLSSIKVGRFSEEEKTLIEYYCPELETLDVNWYQ